MEISLISYLEMQIKMVICASALEREKMWASVKGIVIH